MDHARSFDFCQQLPRKTITEVHTSDGIYAHQVLLNETWANYCKRRGKPECASEEHDKWITETWDEYLSRAVVRARTLAAFDADNDAKIADHKAADGQRADIGVNVVDMMMAAEKRRIETTRLPCAHTLLLDFDELRRQRFARERLAIEDEESAKRLWIVDEEEDARRRLIAAFIARRDEMIAEAEAKRRSLEEARRKAEEERRLAEERRKAEEDAKRRAEQEAERKRRADEEEAKRVERKRKEDERRAKAKAEREARNKAAGGSTRAALGGDDDQGLDDARSANKGRAARINRMHDALVAPPTIEQVREFATSAGADTTIENYCAKLVDYLGNGNIFFHTCVYIGALAPIQSSGGAAAASADHSNSSNNNNHNRTLEYIAASANCSEKLRSGISTVTSDESSTLASMIKHPRAVPHVGPVACAPPLVHVGSLAHWPPASGEAAFFPIIVNDALWGVLAIDTCQNNILDPEESFRLPDEEGCYDGAGATRVNNEPVAISPEICTFLCEVAKIASNAAATLPSSRHKKADNGFNFDVSKLRDASSLGNLLARFTDLMGKASAKEGTAFDCYISFVASAKDGNATILTHNGFSVVPTQSAVDRDEKKPHHLVGGKIVGNAGAKTFHLPTAANSHFFTEDVSSCEDSSIVVYDKASNHDKKTLNEPLLLIPIVVPKDLDPKQQIKTNNQNSSEEDESDNNSPQMLWGAVGITGNALTSALVPEIVALFWNHVRPMIVASLKRGARSSACDSALEWLTIATGIKNVYIALTHSRNKQSAEALGSAPLEIVAASDRSQRFLIGKVWTAADGGVSHPFVAGAPHHTHEPNATSKHLASLSGPKAVGVKFHNQKATSNSPECETAQLVMCTISQNKTDANVHGILYGDTFHPGSTKSMKEETISASDIEIFRLTAQILAAAFDGEDAEQGADRVQLAIEKDLAGTPAAASLGFLARLFQHATNSVKGITNGQLTELARYPAPPAVIPPTVASAIILLGSSKQSVEWAEVRKKIKQQLIDAIVAFDPTGKKVKKTCVVKAKKLTKGLTASAVFTKGSHPASCLFTWVFISLLLRKFAKSLKDRQENEEENINALMTSGGVSNGSGSSSGGMDSSAVTPADGDDDDGDDGNDDGDEDDNEGDASDEEEE